MNGDVYGDDDNDPNKIKIWPKKMSDHGEMGSWAAACFWAILEIFEKK